MKGSRMTNDWDVAARTGLPPWLRRAGVLTGGAILASLLVMAIAPWQQSVRGQGSVVARSPVDRQQRIDAPIDGRVVRWHVVEGSHVNRGDPIVELSDLDPRFVERLQRRLEATQARIEAANNRGKVYQEQSASYDRVRDLKVRAAGLKIQMVKQKVLAVEQKVQAAQAEVHTTLLNVEREQRLLKEGLSSQRDFELAQLAHNKAKAALNMQKSELIETRASMTAAEAERLQAAAEGATKTQSSDAESQKADAESAYAVDDLAKLEVLKSRQQARIVTADRDGTILSLNGGVGGMVVSAGEQLALLVPETDSRAVEMWVDGNDVPLLHVGRSVRLNFEGWPAVQFVGWPSVAVGTFGGKVAVVDAATVRIGRFRVLITPDPDDAPWPAPEILRQGLRANGWILLDEVPLGWEVWRRFNGFPPSLNDRPPLASDGKEAKGKNKASTEDKL